MMEKYGVVCCPSCQGAHCTETTKTNDPANVATVPDTDLDKVASDQLDNWHDYACSDCGNRFRKAEP
jgi:hypothetical protein